MDWIDADPREPVRIEHRFAELIVDGRLEQRYNYIYYAFETEHAFYWARAYLEDANEVSVYGPFDLSTQKTRIDSPLDPEVIAYLKRRYPIVKRLGPAGYARVD